MRRNVSSEGNAYAYGNNAAYMVGELAVLLSAIYAVKRGNHRLLMYVGEPSHCVARTRYALF